MLVSTSYVQDTALVNTLPVRVKDSALLNDLCYGYIASPGSIRMYWKHGGRIINSFDTLLRVAPDTRFAMNGGMFMENYGPVGLYIENGRQLKGIRRYNNPKVNFGLQPQGVFLLRDGKADVVTIDQFKAEGVRFATQSAPILVLDGSINPMLPHSRRKTIRNGVGIRPDGKVVLAVSDFGVTFREFAQYFIDKGCTSALYLDGGVSGAYGPDRSDYGSFGVLIGVGKE
ncbi:hypothetical protein BUE76_01360 [Cnuella takakiae]|nr:hypothetical protein BUE76_01360 [Cnuella takakiae]